MRTNTIVSPSLGLCECVCTHTCVSLPGPVYMCMHTLVSPSLGLCACVCTHTCVSLSGPVCMCVHTHLCLPPWAFMQVCTHTLVSPSLGLCACAHAHTHMLPQWWVGIGFVEWAGSHLESLGRPDWHMLKYRRWKDSGQRDQFVNLIELQTTRKPTGFVWNLLGVLRSAQASSGGQPALWGPQACFPLYRAGQGDAKGACLQWDALSEHPSLG